MKTYHSLKQSGFSMIELLVTLSLTSILGVMIWGVMEYADRQTKVQTEDLLSLIQRYGASKILANDVSASVPTFNYINIADDNGRPFFVLSRSELCKNPTCTRTFTMSIPAGEVVSKPIFFLTLSGLPNEMIRYSVNPFNVFDKTSHNYLSVNSGVGTPKSFSKSVSDYSPWEKKRLIILQSANSFYDCQSSSQTFNTLPTAACDVTCVPAGSCNFATTRKIQLLGTVDNDEADMTFTPVKSQPDLIKNSYSICRPDSNMDCKSVVEHDKLKKAKDLYEKLPFIPGTDNLTTFSPVELVRYHLERPAPNSPDHKIVLMRSRAEIVGGELSFERAYILMTGIQSIVFTRNNISSPSIEHKLVKVRYQQSVK